MLSVAVIKEVQRWDS